jgi:hypothetical protein
MVPFNLTIEAPHEDVADQLRAALNSVFPDGTDDGGARQRGEDLAHEAVELINGEAFGSNAQRYAVSVTAVSSDGRSTPDALIDSLTLSVRVTARGELAASSQTTDQV